MHTERYHDRVEKVPNTQLLSTCYFLREDAMCRSDKRDVHDQFLKHVCAYACSPRGLKHEHSMSVIVFQTHSSKVTTQVFASPRKGPLEVEEGNKLSREDITQPARGPLPAALGRCCRSCRSSADPEPPGVACSKGFCGPFSTSVSNKKLLVTRASLRTEQEATRSSWPCY